jgi:hypothetical protein
MSKKTVFKNQVANQLGTTYSVSSNTSLTKENILRDGYQFIELSNLARLTLPVPDADLHGIVVRVFTVNQGIVYYAAGFGGVGASRDNVQNNAGETCDFYCGKNSSGSYHWYALTDNVSGADTPSSSSSSSSSSSLSSSSSSSSSG